MSNPTPNGVPGEQGTPWPQYGQDGQAAPMQGAPQGYQGGSSAGGYGGPVVMPTGKLPSRAPGTIMIVLGVILMIIVAPIIFFVTMYMGAQRIADATAETSVIANGGSVEVLSNGSYTVMVRSGTADSCVMVDSDQKSHQMAPFQNEKNIYSADGLAPGTYIVRCEGMESSASLTGMTISAQDLVTSTGYAFIWSTVTGVGGIVVLIVGIVLVVRANGKRREMRQQAMMSAIG